MTAAHGLPGRRFRRSPICFHLRRRRLRLLDETKTAIRGFLGELYGLSPAESIYLRTFCINIITSYPTAHVKNKKHLLILLYIFCPTVRDIHTFSTYEPLSMFLFS